MSKEPTEKKKCGRKQIYGEETTTFSIAVPKSKKSTIKTFVEGLLNTYKTKK